MNKIPGRLHAKDMKPLADLADGRCVLQLGCYCGRGLLVVSDCADKTWVLDDFIYPGGIEGVVEELKSNVDRYADPDASINLLYGGVESWGTPLGADPLGDVDVVYRDADRPSQAQELDDSFALSVLHRRGGVYAWHDKDDNLRWLRIDPMPVEVN